MIVLKGGVPTIAEMRDGTDAVSMGSISAAPGVTTLVLPIPIIGNYTEKWLYDGEAGFIESYKGLTEGFNAAVTLARHIAKNVKLLRDEEGMYYFSV